METALLVEDDVGVRESICSTFEEAGLPIETAPNATEALRKWEANGYNPVLLDLGLPDMDGGQLFVKLRETKRDFRLIIVTSNAAILNEYRGVLAAAADVVLIKPINDEELLEAMRQVSQDETLSGTSEKLWTKQEVLAEVDAAKDAARKEVIQASVAAIDAAVKPCAIVAWLFCGGYIVIMLEMLFLVYLLVWR